MNLARGIVIAAAATAAGAGSASAHTGLGGAGFLSGVLHPFLGADHLLAILAVGLWAGLRGGGALWLWPVSFLALMALGALAAFAPLGLPGVEWMILGSVLVLGAAVAFDAAVPAALGAVLIAFFALFHGHAHGTELPLQAGAVGYGLGFLAATAVLHGVGIALAYGARHTARGVVLRGMGGAIAFVGLSLGLAQ